MKNRLFIRWIGAFAGHEYSDEESLEFELSSSGECACEKVHYSRNRIDSTIVHKPSVAYGLLVKEAAIFRSFGYDCYSMMNSDGKLFATRSRHSAPTKGSWNHHTESWFNRKNAYYGIVSIKPWDQLPKNSRCLMIRLSKEFNLKMFCYNHGALEEIDA